MGKTTKIKALVDRIEEGIAVVFLGEDEDVSLEIPICYLPDNVQEGDVLNFKIALASRKTKEAKKKVADLLKKLKRN